MSNRSRTVLGRMFDKRKLVPPVKIMNPWPEGAETVNVVLTKRIGDMEPGTYTLTLQAFISSEEPKYSIFGSKKLWTQSSLIKLVNAGEIVPFLASPDQLKK